jgi:putative hydrolase
MDPVDALEEIAFLLERDLASSYKTKAFRTAAAAIAPLSDVAERVRDGRLKAMKGIGGTTLAVITEAIDGAVPEYLATLRETSVAPPTSELRSRLRGDLHSHSDWTDGTTSIASMADAARRIGHEYLALTDHSPHLTVANGLSPARLRDQLAEVAKHRDDDFRLLSGIEVDILDDGSLDQVPELLDRIDVVVASVHSKLRQPSGVMTERMLRAIAEPHSRVLGHCTGRLVQGSRGTRPQSTFDARAVFEACVEHDVAVEINSRPERQDPPDDLIRIALDAGCLFAIDSDAHAPGHLGLLDYGAARAQAAGIPDDRIITTWPLDRLLEWLRA